MKSLAVFMVLLALLAGGVATTLVSTSFSLIPAFGSSHKNRPRQRLRLQRAQRLLAGRHDSLSIQRNLALGSLQFQHVSAVWTITATATGSSTRSLLCSLPESESSSQYSRCYSCVVSTRHDSVAASEVPRPRTACSVPVTSSTTTQATATRPGACGSSSLSSFCSSSLSSGPRLLVSLEISISPKVTRPRTYSACSMQHAACSTTCRARGIRVT
jgi:hypothetical protein